MVLTTHRFVWLILGTGSTGIALGTALMTHWLHLDPCHVCIFQRFLMLLFGALALGAALADTSRFWGLPIGLLALGVSVTGAAAAVYQSWMQFWPTADISCEGSTPGTIELLVEWLGQQAPALFMATGFCEDEGFEFFGLSLANLSLLVFLGLSAAVAWLLWNTWYRITR